MPHTALSPPPAPHQDRCFGVGNGGASSIFLAWSSHIPCPTPPQIAKPGHIAMGMQPLRARHVGRLRAACWRVVSRACGLEGGQWRMTPWLAWVAAIAYSPSPSPLFFLQVRPPCHPILLRPAIGCPVDRLLERRYAGERLGSSRPPTCSDKGHRVTIRRRSSHLRSKRSSRKANSGYR